MLSPSITIALSGRLASMSIAYLVLWFLSLGLSIALVVLLRTRWGQSRPLHRCAVLSLLVHLMLAWAAMTVRIVAGDGDGNGGGMGPSIRVRVIDDAVEGPFVAEAGADEIDDAPPLLEALAEPDESPEEEKLPEDTDVIAEETPDAVSSPSTVADVSPEVELPPSLEAIVAADAAEPPKLVDAGTEPSVAESPATAAVESFAKEAKSQSAESAIARAGTEKSVAATAASTSARDSQSPTAPQATSPYSLRVTEGRLGLVEQQGGSGRTETCVSNALRWLAAAQSRDGRWDANEHGAGQEHMVLQQNRGGAGRNADTGITALALLAYLGAGHSHMHGDYQDTVRTGIDFLLRSQSTDGSLFGESTLYAQMYCHSMATFALAEALAMTGDRRLEPAVVKAVNFSIAAQNKSVGGWRYRPGDSGDTSQLGWQMMALASAERAGMRVPASTWERVNRFLNAVRRGSHGGLASYRPDGPASTSMTAEALYCRLLLSEATSSAVDEAAAQEATDTLLASLPTAERLNLYYWYYATLALHHRHAENDRAAAAWKRWNEAMTTAIVATQVTDGPNAGSWNTNTVWGGYGGRIYTTAVATMCLEVYYRYAPTHPEDDRWTSRPVREEPRR